MASNNGTEVRSDGVGGGAGPPGAGVGVQDREPDLVLVGVEVEEELFDLVDDLADAGVGPVHLVHDDHDRKTRLECLAQNEARLGERPFGRVDEEEHPVHHGQCPLHLAAEVGVARRVDDGDLHVDPYGTAVCLARMVMPFSRSRSPESSTRSVSSWLARKAPVWRSMASTNVVLP